MLPTSPTLIDAAQSSSATPVVRVRWSDLDAGVPRLRWSRWYPNAQGGGGEGDGPAGVALPADGSLVRARIDPATSTLYVQRVAGPSEDSDYSAWSSLGSAEASPGLGLHAAGSRVLVGYFDGSAVRVRESTDSGATFGSATAVAFTSGVTAIGCAVRAGGTALVAWASGDELWTSTRSGGSWGPPVAWAHDLASFSGLAVADTEDWALLVSGETSEGVTGCWSTRLGSGVGAPVGDWSALAPVLTSSPGLDVSYRASGVMHVGAPRAVLVESYSGTGAFDRPMIASGLAGGAFEVGEWREPEPFEHDTPYGLAATSRGADAFLATPDGLWHAAVSTTPIDATPAVTAARYEARPGPTGRERLRLTLDASLLDELPAVGREIDFAPGYVTDAGIEWVSGRRLWVTSVERSSGEVRVTAEGALGRLADWRAPRERSWAAGEATVATIAREIARAAGLRVVTGSESLAASTLTPGFVLRAGETAAAALGRLLERVPDRLLGRGIDLRLVEQASDEAPAYDYATVSSSDGAHPIRTVSLAEGEPPSASARVLGSDAVGEAVRAEGSGVAVVVDASVTDAGIADERAEAVLRRADLSRELGTLEASPHPGHEPGDVVAVTDTTLGLDAAPFRVTSVTFDFARQPRGRYVMRLGLGMV